MAPWWHYLVAFFAAFFLVNGIPHFVSGLMGRKFPTAFTGGPPHLDTPQRNILWGGMNFIVGGVLFWLVSSSLGNISIVAELVVIGWASAFFISGVFSRLSD